MSRPFNKYSGKSAFCKVQEPLNGSEYILNKKAKYSFCSPNNKNVCSVGDLVMSKKAEALKINEFIRNFNKTNLYINLYTKLDTLNVCPVADLSGNCEIPINSSINSNTYYTIDPNGELFGTAPCGINNFVSYMIYNH